MTVRDRWKRFISHKSISSSSSSTGESSTTTARTAVSAPAAPGHEPGRPPTTTTTTTPGGSDSQKPPGMLSRALGSWRPNRSPKQPAEDEPRHKLHPSERPLTETNLQHQQLFGAFAMQFGRRRHSCVTAHSGISPGSSRRGSRDLTGRVGSGGGDGGAGAG